MKIYNEFGVFARMYEDRAYVNFSDLRKSAEREMKPIKRKDAILIFKAMNGFVTLIRKDGKDLDIDSAEHEEVCKRFRKWWKENKIKLEEV